MAMGQAAGAAAALASLKSLPICKVKLDDVKDALVKNNAIVPEN